MSTAAITVAALLVASPSITDADRIAANGGFLIGNAHRCGMEDARVTRAGQLIRTLISAASRDDKVEEEATARFSAFFLVSATADPKNDKLIASCKRIRCRASQAGDPPSRPGPGRFRWRRTAQIFVRRRRRRVTVPVRAVKQPFPG